MASFEGTGLGLSPARGPLRCSRGTRATNPKHSVECFQPKCEEREKREYKVHFSESYLLPLLSQTLAAAALVLSWHNTWTFKLLHKKTKGGKI